MPYPTADTGGAIIIVVVMFFLALFVELDERSNKEGK
jgi:hypothetical protein